MSLIAPAATAALIVALEAPNRQKIERTLFPVTPTDLVMLFTTPARVLISIGAPDWTCAALYLTTGLARSAILVYGDHQLCSFTGGGGAMLSIGLDFSAVRKDESKRLTLVQFRSSRPNVLNCCGGAALPMTPLPTPISASVASSLDGL
jgi:hypothetical protein